MNKKFKPISKQKWLIFILPIIPLLQLIFSENFEWMMIFYIVSYSLLTISLCKNYNTTVAEIKDNKIYFYSGIGLYDPNELELSRINFVEKKAKKMLVIIYDGDKRLSIEAEKSVIDQIVKALTL